MPKNKHLRGKAKFTAEYVPAQLCEGKEWYIYLWAPDLRAEDPTGLKREKYKVNRIKNKRDRYRYAMMMIDKFNRLPESGWNPGDPAETQNPNYTVSEVISVFLRDRLREVKADSQRIYTSQAKLICEYMAGHGMDRIRVREFGKGRSAGVHGSLVRCAQSI